MSGPNGEGPLPRTFERPTLPDPADPAGRWAARQEIDRYMIKLCRSDPAGAMDLVVRMSQLLRDHTSRS